jgi:hypothetical protein
MSFDSIHNYYERLVYAQVRERFAKTKAASDYLADVACIALNHLPPRYIRFDVDMAFYLSPIERDEIEAKIRDAIDTAVDYINKRKKLASR